MKCARSERTLKTNFITRGLLFVPRKIFIAGRTRLEVLAKASELNRRGFSVTIDVLGEHSRTEDEVEAALKEYKDLVNELAQSRLAATISIKLSHFGLGFNYGLCSNSVLELVKYANARQIGVEFDMEQYRYNQDTIDIFDRTCRPAQGNRICLQANILDSYDKLEYLHAKGHAVRLVRGAYKERPSVAETFPKFIQENLFSFVHFVILQAVLAKSRGQPTIQHAFGTGDIKVINHLKIFVGAYELKKSDVEFQLLYGYLDLGRRLLKEGYPVRIYMPYGDDWAALGYVWRRIKNPRAWKLFFNWLFKKKQS